MGVDAAKQVYDGAYAGEGHSTGTFDWKILDGLDAKGLKILTLGGGDGADLWDAAAQHEVTLLDGSASGVESAQAHGIKAMLADLEQPLPFADEAFDVVVCKDLLEHLVSPIRLLQEIRRVLKKGGRFVVSVPNHFYLPFRLKMLFGGNMIWKTFFHDHTQRYDEWDYMHLRFFTYQGFDKFLALGGFKPQKRYLDFGTLAHYTDPEAFHLHMMAKFKDRPKTSKSKIYFYGLRPAYRAFDFVLPRPARSALTAMAPGVLCAGFYYHCVRAD
jgi:SAM-dependent methyltransferase